MYLLRKRDDEISFVFQHNSPLPNGVIFMRMYQCKKSTERVWYRCLLVEKLDRYGRSMGVDGDGLSPEEAVIHAIQRLDMERRADGRQA